jgi:type II secretory ATPase GspE/PulE/Tfp pilus assembly ATPase PilB-like protein
MSDQFSSLRIGDFLVDQQIITQDQLNIALTEQRNTRQQLGKVLVRLGLVSEQMMRDALSSALGQESVDLSQATVHPDALTLLPISIAKRFHILPIYFDRETNEFTIAIADTFNLGTIDQIQGYLGGSVLIKPLLAGEMEILAAIDTHYGIELSIDSIINEMETGETDPQNLQDNEEFSKPLIRLVDALLTEAVTKGASDIHFNPEGNYLRLRYRIDGVLHEARTLHKKYWPSILVRLKILAELNITETRSPQDGRIALTVSDRNVDFRVSTLPTVHGENVVLRILDSQQSIVPLDKLTLSDNNMHKLRLCLARPEGIILVTGPTGSGKTTTLYSMLNHINSIHTNIMTLEDPVEYPLEIIRQTQINEAANMSFANGIRALLRQDPDVILVGEIRDGETADMALKASMTGHKVFSTLHTNSAVGAIPRLIDMGVKSQLLAGNIVAILGQRLVRKLCNTCKEGIEATETECQILGIPADNPPIIHHARGCAECTKGYRGRMGIVEVLRVSNELDELIALNANTIEILKMAQKEGYKNMTDDGLLKVTQGLTTLEEVARVVDLTARVD